MEPPPNTQDASSSNTTPMPTPGPSPVPPPIPVETHPNRAAFKPLNRTISDPKHLAPEDAFKAFSPPRLRPLTEITGSAAASSAAAAALRPAVASLRAPPAIPPVAQARLAEERRKSASKKRRQPHVWRKLLWIKQHGYPDNYTDTKTFLAQLQRPRLDPYDFWPLVADSTVIVQHVCSVAIFICAYAGIYQDRMSPVTVVTCGTLATLLGWILWDYWMGQEEAAEMKAFRVANRLSADLDDVSSTSSGGSAMLAAANGYTNGPANGHVNGKPVEGRGLGLTLSTSNLSAKNSESSGGTKHGQSLSKSSFQSISPIDSLNEAAIEPFPTLQTPRSTTTTTVPSPIIHHSPTTLPRSVSPRNQVRLKTFKSALLIYFALLGLSPILKSLTKSTSPDSIWALATWLLIINIFFFDYGTTTSSSKTSTISRPQSQTVISSGPSLSTPVDPSLTPPNKSSRAPPFPSSLSTNAALMASTVLASRLVTTTAVFSLTLFSIQVFGLFPVFRRHLRSVSMSFHALLTMTLIVLATSGLGLILSQSYTHTYGDCGYCLSWIWHVISRSIIGIIVFGGTTLFVMGACSWWLIGLQRYKNVVIGPWDTAKPVLAGGGYARRGTGID